MTAGPAGEPARVRVDDGDACVLCRLVARQLPVSVVHEDEHVVALMDHQPVNPGHVLVVPRRHVPLLDELDEDLVAHAYRVAHRLSRALRRSGLRCDGVNVLLADGAAAGQEVPHVHVHVFPRSPGDGRISGEGRVRDRADLDEAATQVRAGLRRL